MNHRTTAPSDLSRGRTPASLAENPYAGQGPVLLDIGADTGGLVVRTDADLLGAEIEIILGVDRRGEGHAHGPHAEVLDRPLPDGTSQPCAVFPDLTPGWYTLQVMPHGDCMSVRVHAGMVTFATWESQPRTA